MIDLLRPLGQTPVEALGSAANHAPYLARLIQQEADLYGMMETSSQDTLLKGVIQHVEEAAKAGSEAECMTGLRRAKRQAHLLLSGADLSGAWSLDQVTGAMSRFADAAASSALAFSANAFGLTLDGLFLIALGKMGAGELNYSSDIDIAAFYDPDVFAGGPRGPKDTAARIIRLMTRLLEERTGDGYVLRTDLRLRPDPGSTPVAVSTRMAELYYESVGQNWERMVWIKARAFAGDMDSAERFLAGMQPFVWRQHLDYWAISDIHAIKAMINASADRAALNDPHADVKLGPGGIREIEFFVQTQQLIMGGRDTHLRGRDTLGALRSLQECGLVATGDADVMAASYKTLRTVEHRIQMRLDEQTHTLPKEEDRRAAIARLCGIDELSVFDKWIADVRAGVHDVYSNLFDHEARETYRASQGNLVFTGVDDDPGTVKTLAALGFQVPSAVIDTVRQWHRGHVSATRTARGRELLTALLPGLLSDMSETGEPDMAFRRFCAFLERLSSGVQTLAMLLAEKDLRRDVVATLALAPRLATTLGRRPQLLEALLRPDQVSPPCAHPDLPFEEAIDLARRHVRDEAFLIGHDLLHGRVAAVDAGGAYSELADRTIAAMAGAAEAETVRRFGPVPGTWCVCALGKLGGRAMTAGSDLDLMVLYEPTDYEGATAWFTRFTQRLITALSVETAEGRLYEVDMRLRPSGRAGPVAVRFSGFERYHREDAWTWEHMTLTRLRPICDTGGLSEKVGSLTKRLLNDVPRHSELTGDILDMRQRLARDKPGRGLWDLKMGAGGLVDLEFLVQRERLMLEGERPLVPVLSDAIDMLQTAGRLTEDEAVTLLHASNFLSSLQQIQRLALTGDVDPAAASSGLKDRLARAVGVPDFNAASASLADVKSAVLALRQARIGVLADEAASEL